MDFENKNSFIKKVPRGTKLILLSIAIILGFGLIILMYNSYIYNLPDVQQSIEDNDEYVEYFESMTGKVVDSTNEIFTIRGSDDDIYQFKFSTDIIFEILNPDLSYTATTRDQLKTGLNVIVVLEHGATSTAERIIFDERMQ